jgi:hypothetical protein
VRRALELCTQGCVLTLALLQRPALVLGLLFELDGPPKRDGGAPDSGETLGIAPIVLYLFVLLVEACEP